MTDSDTSEDGSQPPIKNTINVIKNGKKIAIRSKNRYNKLDEFDEFEDEVGAVEIRGFYPKHPLIEHLSLSDIRKDIIINNVVNLNLYSATQTVYIESEQLKNLRIGGCDGTIIINSPNIEDLNIRSSNYQLECNLKYKSVEIHHNINHNLNRYNI